MKPSQFRRIEGQAIKMRHELGERISRAVRSGNTIPAEIERRKLDNLVKTMRSLKNQHL